MSGEYDRPTRTHRVVVTFEMGEVVDSFDSRVEAVECVDRLCDTPPPVTKEAILAREGAG